MIFRFNDHHNLEGLHAFLSPSGGSWVNYDAEKLISVYDNKIAIEHGTKLHDLAAELIEEKIKVKACNKTFNMYVNDAIGYRMTPEVCLFYSENCFGHADAISYDPKKKFLRIHDLKTGHIKAHIRQLKIYAALFCLEYRIDPIDISYELRIYQGDEIEIDEPDPFEIKELCDIIVEQDKLLKKHVSEAYYGIQ